MNGSPPLWWLTPALLLVVAITEIVLIFELRGVKNESRLLRESLNALFAAWGVVTVFNALLEWVKWNKRTPPD